MKIKVDKMPDIPMQCLFSYWNCEYGYICRFSNERCKTTENCKYLDAEERQGVKDA